MLLASLAWAGPADRWPQWRGPEGNGRSDQRGLPEHWSESAGLAWKCPLPEWGNSTPAIWDQHLFVTSQVDDKLLLVCIDRSAGKVLWTEQVGSGTANRKESGQKTPKRGQQKFHTSQNLATPSPVTDGEVVIAHFGNGDLAAYDFTGRKLWKRNLQDDYGTYTIWWGHANSPVLSGDLVISICLQDSCTDVQTNPAPSYVVAHDKRTGRVAWKVARTPSVTSEPCDAYTTPIFRSVGGRTEMVIMGGQTLDAYDPASGRRLWWLEGLDGNRVITGPVAAGGRIFATEGMRKALLAVDPRGDGVQAPATIAWKYDQATPDSPTPVVVDKLLFMVSDNGIAQCLDAGSGELRWKERMPGSYRASPLAADGRVYFLNMEGLATVVAAEPTLRRLAENKLDDKTIASPAVAGGRLYLRGQKALYCVGSNH